MAVVVRFTPTGNVVFELVSLISCGSHTVREPAIRILFSCSLCHWFMLLVKLMLCFLGRSILHPRRGLIFLPGWPYLAAVDLIGGAVLRVGPTAFVYTSPWFVMRQADS